MKLGLPELALKSANKRVTEVLSVEKSLKKRRKEQAGYSNKDRASIGRYAAENGNSRVLIHFKSKYPKLGESTICSFSSIIHLFNHEL